MFFTLALTIIHQFLFKNLSLTVKIFNIHYKTITLLVFQLPFTQMFSFKKKTLMDYLITGRQILRSGQNHNYMLCHQKIYCKLASLSHHYLKEE